VVKVLTLDRDSIQTDTEITGRKYLTMPTKTTTTKTKSKSKVNEAGNYTKPSMRKRLFEKIKAGSRGGKPGQWSARKAQLLAKEYKDAGGGYK